MRHSFAAVLPLVLLLAACGNDNDASPTAPGAPASGSAVPPSAEPAVAASEGSMAATPPAEVAAPAGDEAELTYEPIDISKLDNSWWRQYNP